MILPPNNAVDRKRWVYKIADLKLDPFKFPDEESKEYSKDSDKVGNLVTPNIIVSEELDKGFGRKYSLFDNYVQVYHLCNLIRKKGFQPHLYEICPYYMKIHFDIDIKEDDLESKSMTMQDLEGDVKYHLILRPFLTTIHKVFGRLFPLNYDPDEFHKTLLVFEAHRFDKISFHIVVDDFYLSCYECYIFYKEVTDELQREGMVMQSEWADPSVYKKNQAFRLFGSNKATMRGKEGTKNIYNGPELSVEGHVFSRDCMIQSSFKNETYNPSLVNLRILERSLLSHTLGSVRLTMNKDKISKKNQQTLAVSQNPKEYCEVELSDDTMKSIMETFNKSPLSKTETGEPAFAFEKVTKQGLIYIKRVRKSFCKICERTHDNENSWLTGNLTGDVYLFCRRAQEAKIRGGIKIYVGNYVH